MPRIEIELTSSRPDGTWTWRAAGARQPKGALDGAILPEGSKVGEVMRAEVTVDVDGMTVTSVAPAKTKKPDVGRLEVIGPPQRERPDVTVERTSRPGRDERDRDRGDRGDRRERGPRRDGERAGPRRDGERGGERGGDRGGAGPRRDGDRAGAGPGGGGPRRERSGPSRPPGPSRPAGGADRPERSRPPRDRSAERSGPPPPAARPRPKRLNAGRVHREAVIESLPPEQRPIAEQVLRGGVPAVRQAIEEQNAAARASGAPEVRADALVALAEGLLPKLRAAEWRDRADAAIGQLDEIGLRDLRALVVGADVAARDEESRELASRLRQALEERSTKERDAWLAEIGEALDAGRVVRALRSSCRPPEPGARFPTELAERLSTAASEAMAPDVAPDRWAAVLEAVTSSPVRRMVKPLGLPEPPGNLLQVARQAADRVPGLGPLVGAGPPPAIGARRPAPPPRPRPPSAAPPIPPPPAAAEAPAEPAAPAPPAPPPTAEGPPATD
ncbi:MAG: hypothetical protein ACLGI2_04635 [Acidimicrobiia bacterium]